MHQDSKARIFFFPFSAKITTCGCLLLEKWVTETWSSLSICMAVLSDSDVGSCEALERVFFQSPRAVWLRLRVPPGSGGLCVQQMALGSRRISLPRTAAGHAPRHLQQTYLGLAQGWKPSQVKRDLFHSLKTSCCLNLKYWCTVGISVSFSCLKSFFFH